MATSFKQVEWGVLIQYFNTDIFQAHTLFKNFI